MASLTETAYYARRLLVIFAILIVGYIVLKTSFGLASKAWRKAHPPAPPPPTVSFGKLPKIAFPDQNQPKDLTFKLETIDGQLPKLETVAKVYLIPRKAPTFLALDQAKTKAKRMGFPGSPEAIDKENYRWQGNNDLSATLEMNILDGSFRLLYPYKNDQSLLDAKNLPNSQQAAQEAKAFLSAGGLLDESLKNGRVETDYLRLDASELVPALSLSEANFIRLNLFRSNIDNLMVFPPDPATSPVSFIFSGERTAGKRIVGVNYLYRPIDQEIFSTYPLKPVASAWQEIQQNNGFIAKTGNNLGQAIIRRIYLAYYDSPTAQSYLQPIYVFEGDGGFFAYAPAIDPKWSE